MPISPELLLGWPVFLSGIQVDGFDVPEGSTIEKNTAIWKFLSLKYFRTLYNYYTKKIFLTMKLLWSKPSSCMQLARWMWTCRLKPALQIMSILQYLKPKTDYQIPTVHYRRAYRHRRSRRPSEVMERSMAATTASQMSL